MKPSVGRVVHYQSFGTPNGEYNSLARAAVITAADPNPIGYDGKHEESHFKVALCILNPTGMFFNTDVQFSAEPKAGFWSWPPRVA